MDIGLSFNRSQKVFKNILSFFNNSYIILSNLLKLKYVQQGKLHDQASLKKDQNEIFPKEKKMIKIKRQLQSTLQVVQNTNCVFLCPLRYRRNPVCCSWSINSPPSPLIFFQFFSFFMLILGQFRLRLVLRRLSIPSLRVKDFRRCKSKGKTSKIRGVMEL